MAQQTDHIGDVNKMVEHHIVDTNKMITSVEWLMENIQKVHKMDWDIVFIQAKAMEKEQIMNAYSDGVFDGTLTDEFYEDSKVSGEQYYNQTYKQ